MLPILGLFNETYVGFLEDPDQIDALLRKWSHVVLCVPATTPNIAKCIRHPRIHIVVVDPTYTNKKWQVLERCGIASGMAGKELEGVTVCLFESIGDLEDEPALKGSLPALLEAERELILAQMMNHAMSSS